MAIILTVLASSASFPYVLVLLVISYILLSYLRNPLRKIPAAHPLSHFTSFWINSVRWRGTQNATLKEAHARLGPVVCLGPKEISINCVKGGVRDVYGGGFEKAGGDADYNWYSFFTNFNGVPNMFSTGHNKPHSRRKRMISNIYSKSVITSSPPLLAQMSSILYERILPYLAQKCDGPDAGVLNIYPLLNASTMDVVTGYIFGLSASTNFIDDPEKLMWFLNLYKSRDGYSFWPQEFPRLTTMLKKWLGYRLSPRRVDDANAQIETLTMKMCEAAEVRLNSSTSKLEDVPTVYQQLHQTLSKEARTKDSSVREELASEVLDHLAAGFDTSGITLIYIVHELSQHHDVQQCLQEELRTLSPRIIASSSPDLPDPKTVDALPFLHAVVWETLRLHSAIPGPQPRFAPVQGCRLGPDGEQYFIPGGVRVSASAGLLHANEDVYKGASKWRPQRWLGLDKMDVERKKDMESRWFWAFGSGGRMCVGSNLAVYQMKYIVAALYSNYSTSIVDDTGIEQLDAYTAPPKSDKLIVRLQKLTESF